MKASELRDMIENSENGSAEVVVWDGEDWVTARVSFGVMHKGDEGDITQTVLAIDWKD